MNAKLERRLDIIEKAGGLNMSESLFKYSPAFTSLSRKEKSLATFSFFAYFFTIFYYIYHGMWKKGLVLLSVGIIITVISLCIVKLIFPSFLLSFARGSWGITSVLFATRAPMNLYSTYRLNDNGWNPIKDLQNFDK